MCSKKYIEPIVGLFMLAGIAALLVLAFKVSGLTSYAFNESYEISANFDNIGDLKPRAPVTIAGVRIGQVQSVDLDKSTYKAIVKLKIATDDNNIPVDSTASIVTAGLLGANYVMITPGFENDYLAHGGQIQDTHSALQLETMIGQLLFSMDKGDKKK